jgi:hypothetical protein
VDVVTLFLFPLAAYHTGRGYMQSLADYVSRGTAVRQLQSQKISEQVNYRIELLLD